MKRRKYNEDSMLMVLWNASRFHIKLCLINANSFSKEAIKTGVPWHSKQIAITWVPFYG